MSKKADDSLSFLYRDADRNLRTAAVCLDIYLSEEKDAVRRFFGVYTVMKAARAVSGTSVFGLVNPELNRTDTRIGRPVYGLFKDLGNSFFFSRYAVSAKLPTAASDISIVSIFSILLSPLYLSLLSY